MRLLAEITKTDLMEFKYPINRPLSTSTTVEDIVKAFVEQDLDLRFRTHWKFREDVERRMLIVEQESWEDA